MHHKHSASKKMPLKKVKSEKKTAKPNKNALAGALSKQFGGKKKPNYMAKHKGK